MFAARRLSTLVGRSSSALRPTTHALRISSASPLYNSQVRFHGYNLKNFDYEPVECEYNADGQRITKLFGEEVVVPLLEASLEWVLTSPPDYHNFDESPVVAESTMAETKSA